MLLFIGRIIARCVYRVRACGVENLPSGGFLLLPNHITWVDAVVLQLACPRPIRFLIYESIYRRPLMNPFFRALGAIPITQSKAKQALRGAAEQIRKGEIVCIFPEGELSRTGILLRLKRGYELVAHAAEAPVVPVWLDRLWGSIFSFYGGRYFKKFRNTFAIRSPSHSARRFRTTGRISPRCERGCSSWVNPATSSGRSCADISVRLRCAG